MTKEEKRVNRVAMQLFRLRWSRGAGSQGNATLDTPAGRSLLWDLDRACAAQLFKRRRK